MVRELRGSKGRWFFFTLCLAVGVASVTTVAGLASGVEEGIRGRSRDMLGADLAVSARRPLPEELDELLAEVEGLERTDVLQMATLVAAVSEDGEIPGKSELAQVRVVEDAYPHYGTVVLEPDPGDDGLAAYLAPDTAVVASELLERLDLEVGDSLRIGVETFRIAAEVLEEPDQVAVLFTLGPRIFLSPEGLDRAALRQDGSRIRHRALLRVPPTMSASEIQGLARNLRRDIPDAEYMRIETYSDAQPSLRRGVDQVAIYLGLVALLSLLVGGVGVAQATRAWIATRLDSIAVQVCIGMRPREVLMLYLGQALVLGLGGSLVGALIGSAITLALPGLLADFAPAELLDPWQPAAFLRGIVLGTGVALLFSMPPLLGVLRVPPLRVLRRDVEPPAALRGARVATVLAVLLGILGAAYWQSKSVVIAGAFTGAVAVSGAVLALAALGLVALAKKAPRRGLGFALRQGVSALARPGAGTIGAMVALGLGWLVVLAMHLVEGRLLEELDGDLPETAPTAFLVDVQSDQWEGVEGLLVEEQARHIDSVPVIVARLASIDGATVSELLEDRERRERWVLTREQRLTYLEELPEDNRILEGELWSEEGVDEVSIEEGFAEDLGVGLGSTLRLDIQGVPIDLRVTSIRSVDWRTFGINFFLVAEPGVLDKAPQFRIAAAALPEGRESMVQDRLAGQYPNVTLLDVRELLTQVAEVLGHLGLGVRLLGSFTVLAGLAILFGAVGANTVRREGEIALLKTLGLTRRGVVVSFAVEYGILGLVSGALGGIAATLVAWGVVTQGMNLDFSLDAQAILWSVLGSAVLSAAAGLAASVRALQLPPIRVLREG